MGFNSYNFVLEIDDIDNIERVVVSFNNRDIIEIDLNHIEGTNKYQIYIYIYIYKTYNTPLYTELLLFSDVRFIVYTKRRCKDYIMTYDTIGSLEESIRNEFVMNAIIYEFEKYNAGIYIAGGYITFMSLQEIRNRPEYKRIKDGNRVFTE
jgi:hypothetical protein